MPRWIWVSLAILAGLFAIDRLLLWCEARGWVYWRRSNVRTSGALTGALHELQAILDPSTRAAMEAREEEKVQRDESGEPPVSLETLPDAPPVAPRAVPSDRPDSAP